MSKSFSTFTFDKNVPKTDCVVYRNKILFSDLTTKGYPDGVFKDSNGASQGPWAKCVGSSCTRICTDFGQDAGKILCPVNTTLILREQRSQQYCEGSYADSRSGIPSTKCCWFHPASNSSGCSNMDCYYTTLDNCGNIDPANGTLGTAIPTITGYKFLDPNITQSADPFAKENANLVINQTISQGSNINGEGVVGCTYQYDFSNFITNQTNTRKITSWINDIYNGITYLT